MANPTVVVAHLSDADLKNSINQLVQTVETQTTKMADNFDTQIKRMQESLKSLGTTKVNLERATNVDFSKEETKLRQVKKAVDETTSYPTEMRMPDQAKNARDSYLAFMQGYKAQAQQLQNQIDSWENLLYARQIQRIKDIDQQIASINQKIKDTEHTPQSNRKQVIDDYKAQIESLRMLQQQLNNNPLWGQDTSYMEKYRAERERVLNMMKEETSEQKAQTDETKKTVQTEEQRIVKLQEEWELQQKQRQAQAQAYDIQNERNRQLDMENAKTAENLAFQERINAARQAKETGEGKRARETNELTGAIAGLLGIQEKEIAVTDVESASQHRLTNYLHQLQKAYKTLDKEGMDASHGRMLADEIQRVSRALSEMQKQMNRPTSLKNALGLDEKTLDNIAYKIQQLNAYRGGLNITDPKQVSEMKQVETEIDRLKKKQDELMGKNTQMIVSNNALQRSWNYMKNRLAFYFTVGASTQFVKNLIEVRSQYEMNERALGILIDSAERGTQIFNELSQMALVSPYTLIELSNAARQLTAYDVAAKDVVDTTRRLADMASAVGIPIERLTYALGQIKAYGYLNSRDARMFLNAGIPLVKNLADHYTELEGKMVSVGDVYDRIKKKAIGYNDVMQVITEMTDEGGKFFDFQAKMADTLKVQLANLTLAWNNMLNDIGKSEQGVLVGGIKGLKELFLQWKNIDTLIRNLAITFGLAKFIQLLKIGTLGMDAFGKKMVWQILVGKQLQKALYSVAGSLNTVISSPLTWWALLATAVVSAGMAFYDANKAVKEFNQSIIDGGKENYNNTKKFLEQNQELRDSLYTKEILHHDNGKTGYRIVPQDLDNKEAEKAWVSIREQIELTSQSGDYFIGKLLQMDDVNDRVRKGFEYLQKIQDVYGAMQNMDDSTIAIKETYNAWWNLGLAQDGVIGNLKEYINTRNLAEQAEAEGAAWHETETVFAKRIKGLWESAGIALAQYQSDLKVTIESMADFAKGQGFDSDQEREFFSQTVEKLVQKNNLGEKESLQFRLDAEEQYKEERIKQFNEVIAFERKRAGEAAAGAEKDRLLLRVKAAQQEKAAWLANQEEMFGAGRVLFEGFTKYMTRQHMSEIQKMFGNMTKKEIEQIDWSKPKWRKWAEEHAKAFSEQFGMSFDELKKWVNDANQMTIFIKTVVQKPDEKSVYDTLTEADKDADGAWEKIQRLNKHKRELEAKGASGVGTRDIDTDYLNTLQEISDAQDDYNKAIAKGGHSKKKDTANTLPQKQAESELQKALKDELQLIDKVRGAYKDLTKEGVSHADALKLSTQGFDESVGLINKTFKKFGIAQLDLAKFAGVSNPHEIVNMLQTQLEKLMKSPAAKPAEIKDLQVKIRDLKLDVAKFDQKTITDSLNNELGKLKDEYDLAVELDANPELGDMFAQKFGIDTSEFPHTINEYMSRVQQEFDKVLGQLNYASPLDVFRADEGAWLKWGRAVGIVTDTLDAQGNVIASDTDALDKFKGKFVEAQGVAKTWAQNTLKATKDLEYKLADTNGKIAIEQKKLEDLKKQFTKETNKEQKHLLELQIQDQENTIAKLKEEALQLLPTYVNLFNSIAEHSALVTRRIAKRWKEALVNAVKNADGTYTITDPQSGAKATVTQKTYGTQLDKVNGKLRETQSSFKKIKEAFTKNEDGIVDWSQGLLLVTEEAQKAAEGLHTVADIIGQLGGSDDAVETINDIATSMEGVATAGQGVAQMASGDYIGGAVNVLKGTWQAISTWFDNSDKKISKEVQRSERAVKSLELAYIDLQHAMDEAYGTATVGAQKAAIANKELQLAELKRQLQLEESRKSRNRDDDRILELRKQIKALEYDISDSTNAIVNGLLGISSVGDALENMMGNIIETFRQGGYKFKDIMKDFKLSINDMVANMVMQMYTTKILQPWFEEQWNAIKDDIEKRGGDLTMNDIQKYAEALRTGSPIIEKNLRGIEEFLRELGLLNDKKETTLSALQQGISSITEETASSLEAYMNGVSQQVYLQSDLLTQIRDAVVGFDLDVQTATQAQMLLQLQQSYAVQMAIQSILLGWSNPSGQAVRIEMIS